MQFPPCGQAIAMCEACLARAGTLAQLSVRTPTGRLIVVTLCRACYASLAPRVRQVVRT